VNGNWFLSNCQWSETLGGLDFLVMIVEAMVVMGKLVGGEHCHCGDGGAGYKILNLVLEGRKFSIRSCSSFDRV
jgi:hypothetical protein